MQKFPLWRVDSKSCRFVCRIHRIRLAETVSGIARSRLSDSGEGAKEWGRRECERRAKSGAGRDGKKGSSSCFFFFFSCSRFLNSVDPTISQPGTGYIRKGEGAYGFQNIWTRVTGQEANIIPKHRRCLVICLGHRLTPERQLSHPALDDNPSKSSFP